MKPKKSCGPDELPVTIFKDHYGSLHAKLLYLFNLSLNAGIVPNSLKIAKVVPIFKAGDKKLINNYRPISLLNSISKILEKIIANTLLNFLNKIKLFNI